MQINDYGGGENIMDFAAACAEAAMIPEFVSNYNRLTGNNFAIHKPKNHIEAMIDKATGFDGIIEDEVRKFAEFFYEFVWSRLPDEAFAPNPIRKD